jgi:hypothetical protein
MTRLHGFHVEVLQTAKPQEKLYQRWSYLKSSQVLSWIKPQFHGHVQAYQGSGSRY